MTDDIAPISDREREVLELVVRGASNKEIAQHLSISALTVKTHLRNMFGKAGVSSRVQLATYAIERHLVSVGQPAGEPTDPGLDEPGDVNEPGRGNEPAELPAGAAEDAPPPGGTGPAEAITEEAAGVWSNGAARTEADVQVVPVPVPPPAIRAPRALTISPRSVIFFLVLLGVIQIFTIGLIVTQMGQGEETRGNAEGSALPSSAIAATSTATTSTRWKTRTSMPVPRTHFAVVAYEYENRIYVIGGTGADGTSAAVSRYDPRSDTWVALDPKPTAVSHVGAMTVGGMIYVPGGEGSDGSVLDILEAYDPRSQQWSTLAAVPEPRSRYALASFEGKLYLFGGWDGQRPRSEVFLYDPASDTWEQGDPLSVPRSSAGAAVVGSRIHVIGGENETGPLTLHERYDPTRPYDQRWEHLSPLPMGVATPAVVGLANILVVFAPHQHTAMQYVPATDSWNRFAIPEGMVLSPAVASLFSSVFVFGEPDPTGEAGGASTSVALHEYQAIYTLFLPEIQ
jgi:DNA-binding CsgD family transcriptional regulator